MAKVLSKYFIAIVPAGELQEKATELKFKLRETFNLKYALRSPAHITMKMPFLWNDAKEDRLIRRLATFFRNQPKFSLSLGGFGRFGRRVIYLKIENQPFLFDLQRDLVQLCKTKLNLKKELSDEAYHPHMTVAFKDMKTKLFDSYWDFLKDLDFNQSLDVREVALLKKDREKWIVYQQFPLAEDQLDESVSSLNG